MVEEQAAEKSLFSKIYCQLTQIRYRQVETAEIVYCAEKTRRGGRITERLVSIWIWPKKKIHCYLSVLKLLNLNQSKWMPALQWVFSALVNIVEYLMQALKERWKYIFFINREENLKVWKSLKVAELISFQFISSITKERKEETVENFWGHFFQRSYFAKPDEKLLSLLFFFAIRYLKKGSFRSRVKGSQIVAYVNSHNLS